MEYSRKLEIEKMLGYIKKQHYLKRKIKSQILKEIGYQNDKDGNSSFFANKVNKIVNDIVSETNDNIRLFFEYKLKDNGYDLLENAKSLNYSLEKFIKTFENIRDKVDSVRYHNYEWSDLIEYEKKLRDCEININSFLRAKEIFEFNNLICQKFHNNAYEEFDEDWDIEEEEGDIY